jgi:hypothetical protein
MMIQDNSEYSSLPFLFLRVLDHTNQCVLILLYKHCNNAARCIVTFKYVIITDTSIKLNL